MEISRKQLEASLRDVEMGILQDGYHPVFLQTRRGAVQCRYYPVDGTTHGAIWVGGVGGDWDTPARGLYADLCPELQSGAIASGIASLRLRYRYPTDLIESVYDVLAGIVYLQEQGIDAIALIGHSFGGAVVIQTAVRAEAVRTVVTLASQSYGAEVVPALEPRCSLLLIHGTGDPILPPQCSQQIYQLAPEPKRLIIYPDATHGLDEVAVEVRQVVRDWVVSQLNRPFP